MPGKLHSTPYVTGVSCHRQVGDLSTNGTLCGVRAHSELVERNNERLLEDRIGYAKISAILAFALHYLPFCTWF